MPQTYMIVPGEGSDPGYISNYDDAGNPIGTPLYQLPGRLQNYRIGQGAVYDPMEPLRGYQFGPAGTNFLTVSENGSVAIQVGTSFGAINQGTSLTTEYGMAGTVDIKSEMGTLTIPITFAKLARTGKRWAEYTNPETGETSRHMVAANLTLRELNTQSPGWTRWLSAEDVVTQALTGELYRLSNSQDPVEQDLFKEMLNAMGISISEWGQDNYVAMDGWVAMMKYNLSAARRYVLA